MEEIKKEEMDYKLIEAYKQAAKEIAEETGQDEELVWKIMKKIIFLSVCRI